MNDDSSATESQSSLKDEILSVGRDIQNRSNHRVWAEVVENRLFKEHFGISVTVALIVWNLLVENDLVPEKGQMKHLLWTLLFLKVYPKQGPVCSIVGGSDGAIDPKTFRKWVWAFIFAISYLEEEVVSLVRLLLLIWLVFSPIAH